MKLIQYATLFAALTFNVIESNGQNDDLYYDPDRRSAETNTSTYQEDSYASGYDNQAIENEDLEYYDEYYYTNRIRRFQRPLSGMNYYDPYYTDLAYVDPWYDPYTASSWSRWNNWNSMSWGYGGFMPSYYYGWGYRPGFNLSFGNSWGWNNGWGGYNNWGYNNWGYNNWGYNNYCGWNNYNSWCGGGWGGYNDWGWNNNNGNRPNNYGPRPLGSGGSTVRDPNRGVGVRPGGSSRTPLEGNTIRYTPERSDKDTPNRINRPDNTTGSNADRPSRVRSSSSERQPSNVWGKDRNGSTSDQYRSNDSGRGRQDGGSIRSNGSESRPRRETPSSNYNNSNSRPERAPSSTPRSEAPSRSYDNSRSNGGGNNGGSSRSSSPSSSPSRSSGGSSRRG